MRCWLLPASKLSSILMRACGAGILIQLTQLCTQSRFACFYTATLIELNKLWWHTMKFQSPAFQISRQSLNVSRFLSWTIQSPPCQCLGMAAECTWSKFKFDDSNLAVVNPIKPSLHACGAPSPSTYSVRPANHRTVWAMLITVREREF